MGTRHFIGCWLDGSWRVAQYGQFDGYPDGNGRNVLEFCRKLADNRDLRQKFLVKLAATRWLSDADTAAIEKAATESGKHWSDTHPWLSRDASADILRHVLEQPEGLALSDAADFVCDSLFCEWGYVIDFDLGRLEVYRGPQLEPLEPEERFANLPENTKPADWKPGYAGEKFYYPIRLLRWFKLDKLPEAQSFCEILEAADQQRDAEDEAEKRRATEGAAETATETSS